MTGTDEREKQAAFAMFTPIEANRCQTIYRPLAWLSGRERNKIEIQRAERSQ
jgi:hypothetical protein